MMFEWNKVYDMKYCKDSVGRYTSYIVKAVKGGKLGNDIVKTAKLPPSNPISSSPAIISSGLTVLLEHNGA
jgi:hypothetical protein